MSDPPLLDYIARARTSDPQPSHAAAASVKHITEAQDLIQHFLKSYGPMTDEQIYPLVKHVCSPSGARTRRAELVALGKIAAHSESGRTQAGRRCTIWAVA